MASRSKAHRRWARTTDERRRQQRTDEPGWIEAGRGEQVDQPAGRRRLPVRARHADESRASRRGHVSDELLDARRRHPDSPRREQLRVVRVHGRQRLRNRNSVDEPLPVAHNVGRVMRPGERDPRILERRRVLEMDRRRRIRRRSRRRRGRGGRLPPRRHRRRRRRGSVRPSGLDAPRVQARARRRSPRRRDGSRGRGRPGIELRDDIRVGAPPRRARLSPAGAPSMARSR